MESSDLRIAKLAQMCLIGASWLKLAAGGYAEPDDLRAVASELECASKDTETRSFEILMNVFLITEGYLTKQKWDKETWEKLLLDQIAEYRTLNGRL